jgi:ABC-2 type transport system permease protein
MNGITAELRPPARGHFMILARCRLLQLRNTLDQQLRNTPVRAFMVLALLVLIWAALYWILTMVLRQVGRFDLVALVATKQIFVHFFLVLAVMLAFSNAILAFSTIFSREEAGHLLAMPATPRQVIALKWLEGMLLSSWSFLLLGVPLMLAVAANTDVEWYYYPLFVGHFMGFVIIPATLGLLAAWAVAMWAPRSPLAVVVWCAAVLVGVVSIWAWSLMRNANMSEQWLNTLYRQVSIVQQPLLPSTWSAKGVFAAIERKAHVSLFYLAVVAANAAFFSWVSVNIIAANWSTAYSRARLGRVHGQIREGWFTSVLCDLLFPYLRGKVRTLMLKDLRSFARDPAQWTQMVIMMGLLVIYALNLRRLPLDFGSPGIRGIVAFLNLTTISLIMATFTSRFIFPLLSLETQQLWMLGMLPVRRAHVLLVKFVFALTVTGVSGLLVMGLALRALELPAGWGRFQLLVCLAICIGLSGLSVGLGARFPVVGQRNPARIASGFGGTFNLIASMLFVAIEMTGLAVAGITRFGESLPGAEPAQVAGWLAPGLLLLGIVVAVVSLGIGMRHFERLEY